MMHKKNFVAAIKVNGKVLRESSDRVELPFGSEYSILLKNLDTVRMQAQISIDGQDATGWLVVDPGVSVDIERFYRQNQDRGNRFKFIERTERIEEHRGVGVEDGLVRIEFKREKVYEFPKIVEHHTYYHHPWLYYYPRPYTWSNWNFCGMLTANASAQNSLAPQSCNFSTTRSASYAGSENSGAASQSTATMNTQSVQNDAGITVDGSISNQQFRLVAGFECEASEVIMLHLIGKKAGSIVKVARTVEHKLSCDTCGKRNLPIAKFCIECGTSLEKV
jgi:hypothetical protein